ncbi:uncharacterized protein LOC110113924 [Dendrobium catenatum]|uniref:uncharacterized protein LOC110113924 n=1 Tax=Dendrobium catenatum TaxID=906689 RepID=UPI0009F692F7|nr:uncharacterized protein LOC110113924 [Dendrobium catenatum]
MVMLNKNEQGRLVTRVDCDADDVCRRRSKGKGKHISLNVDGKTQRVLKSTGFSPPKSFDPKASLSGMGWYLWSFKKLDAMEGVISSSPWFVNGHIVGKEWWLTKFFPSSMKGLTSPIWIRIPQFPLQCWDENNVAMIASMVGVPLMLDGNMFQWGRREFARVCVRVELDKPLPMGVWVIGKAGRFFQKVEYERISSFCYECGMVGQDKVNCKKVSMVLINSVEVTIKKVQDNQNKITQEMEVKDSYGTLVHVNYKRNKRYSKAVTNVRPV